MRFESRRGQNGKNETKHILQFGKNVFSLQLFFGWSPDIVFQRRFVEI